LIPALAPSVVAACRHESWCDCAGACFLYCLLYCLYVWLPGGLRWFEPAGRRSLPIVARGSPQFSCGAKVFLVSGLADVAVATEWGGALCPLRHAGRGIRPGSIPRSGSLKSHNARLSAVTTVSAQVSGTRPAWTERRTSFEPVVDGCRVILLTVVALAGGALCLRRVDGRVFVAVPGGCRHDA
jgi:hypothetical protein